MRKPMQKTSLAIACSLLLANANAVEVIPPTADVFSAGGLLNQYKQSLDSLVSATPLGSGSTEYVQFDGFQFAGLDAAQQERAQELVKPYLGKKIILGKLISDLERDFQDAGQPFVFILSKNDAKSKGLPLLTATKVTYGKAQIVNESRLNNGLLDGIINWGVSNNAPVDRPQLERNSSVLNEVPGIINQFGMRPGANEGDTDLVAKSIDGPWYGGSATVDNSGTKSLGVINGKADLSLYNLLGFGDIYRFFGLVSANSNMEGVDVSSLVHPSGLRAGVSASRFAYGYNTQTSSVTNDTNGNPAWLNSINTRYTGQSNDIGAYLSFPLTRTEYSRQSLTLNYDYVTNVSNAFVAQQSQQANGPAQQSSAGNFNLSNYTINKLALGTFGVSSLPLQIVSSYQTSITGGNAVQNLAGVALTDAQGAKQMGSYGKLTGSGILSRAFTIADADFNLSASGSVQLANKNLPSSEKAYLGGMTQMQAWAPQAIAADQMVYTQIKLDKPITPELSIGVFVEASQSQQNTRSYQITAPAATVGHGNNFMSDAGLAINYQPVQNVTLTGSVASKLSGNPTVYGTPIQDNSNVRGWIGATVRF